MNAEPETEDYTDPLSPRRNPSLIAHQAAETELLRWTLADRLPSAILIGGPRGIGKATLAFRFARFLLSRASEPEEASLFGAPPPPVDLAVDPEAPTARRIAAGGHADLLTLARAWNPERKKLRTEIVVEQVRSVGQFLHLTPAEGGWRIVIVDGAEEMNRSAANALLKVLEEPPRAALIILVSHAPGRLLPTIRSRCRRLMLQPLAETEVEELLAQHRPDLDDGDRRALAALGEGSIGRALHLADSGGLDLYRRLSSLIFGLPKLDGVALHGFADKLAKADDESFGTLVELLLDFLARLSHAAATGEPRVVLADERADLTRVAGLTDAAGWERLWQDLRVLFIRADAVNLDRKHVVLDALERIAAATW